VLATEINYPCALSGVGSAVINAPQNPRSGF